MQRVFCQCHPALISMSIRHPDNLLCPSRREKKYPVLRHYSEESWCLIKKKKPSMPVKFLHACHTMPNWFVPIANLKLSWGWYTMFPAHIITDTTVTHSCCLITLGKWIVFINVMFPGAPTHVNVCAEWAIILRRAINMTLKLAPDTMSMGRRC